MNIQKKTIVMPLPTADLLQKREEKWHITLPEDYRNFLLENNGGVPDELSFTCNNHSCAITRFYVLWKTTRIHNLVGMI